MITDKRAGHHGSKSNPCREKVSDLQGRRGDFVARTFKKIDSGDTYVPSYDTAKAGGSRT